jgi:hypothetical protein
MRRRRRRRRKRRNRGRKKKKIKNRTVNTTPVLGEKGLECEVGLVVAGEKNVRRPAA